MGAGLAGSIGNIRCIADAGRAVGVIAAKITAVQCQQALHHTVATHNSADAAAVIDIAGTGTVSIPDADVFRCKDIQGFLPADPGKFPFSTFTDPFHRPAKPVFA